MMSYLYSAIWVENLKLNCDAYFAIIYYNLEKAMKQVYVVADSRGKVLGVYPTRYKAEIAAESWQRSKRIILDNAHIRVGNLEMTKLQQQLFDLMSDWTRENWSFVPGLSKEGIDSYLEDLKKDICKMNAIDLRRNIKIWKEQDW